MATTRLGQVGVGVEPYGAGAFAGKAEASGRLNITRLGLMGVPREPYAGFTAKGAAAPSGDAETLSLLIKDVGTMMNP